MYIYIYAICWLLQTQRGFWRVADRASQYIYIYIYIYISVINQLDVQKFCFTISLFHAWWWAHVLIIRRSKLHYTASGIITPIGGRLVHETQFWSPDDEHMCSKHVEAWNKLIVKQKVCASSWLITEITNGDVSPENKLPSMSGPCNGQHPENGRASKAVPSSSSVY